MTYSFIQKTWKIFLKHLIRMETVILLMKSFSEPLLGKCQDFDMNWP